MKLRIFGIIFLTIGVGLLVGMAFSIISTQRFVSVSRQTTGEVIDVVSKTSTDSDGTYSIYYYPVVSFADEGGDEIIFQSSVGSSPPSYSRGEIVTVLYDPSDPYRAKIQGVMSLWGMSIVFGGVGSVLCIIGSVFVFIYLRKKQKKERLMSSGMPVQALYIGTQENTRFSYNGRHPLQILCQYEHGGKVYVFRSEDIWFHPGKSLDGKNLTVWINPQNMKEYYVDISELTRIEEM